MHRLALDLVVLAHFAFILFVIFGALLAWRRPRLRWLHVTAMVYGVLIEMFDWYCPLTILEHKLRGPGPSSGGDGFLTSFLTRWIYWDVPQLLLIIGSILVLAGNLALYLYRSPGGSLHGE